MISRISQVSGKPSCLQSLAHLARAGFLNCNFTDMTDCKLPAGCAITDFTDLTDRTRDPHAAGGGLAGPGRQILGTCGSRPPCPHPNQTGREKGERRMTMRCARTIGRPHPPTGSWGRSVEDRGLTSLAINRDFSESFMRARVPLGEPDPFRRWPARCTGDESPGVTRGPTDRNGPPDAPGSPLRRPFASGWVHLPTPALRAFRGRFSQPPNSAIREAR